MLCKYCGTEHDNGLTAFEVQRVHYAIDEFSTIICTSGPAKAANARFKDIVQCEGYRLIEDGDIHHFDVRAVGETEWRRFECWYDFEPDFHVRPVNNLMKEESEC